MFWRSISTLVAVWPAMLVGTGVVLAGTWIGWVLGRYRHLPVVRGLAWWVTHIILPLLRTSSWRRRAATIFVNNCSILAVVVALGDWPVAAVVGTFAVGMSLGIALRVLSDMEDDPFGSDAADTSNARSSISVGAALNMLEPPAIVAALGLSIGWQSAALTSAQVWQAFGVIVAPVLVIAAGGEALWMGVYCSKRAGRSSDALEPDQASQKT